MVWKGARTWVNQGGPTEQIKRRRSQVIGEHGGRPERGQLEAGARVVAPALAAQSSSARRALGAL